MVIEQKAGRVAHIIKRNPERTTRKILQAATIEFSQKGLSGARVDVIAERAKTNKRMLYHYFGNKEALFLAVLEDAYAGIRSLENDLNLADLPPEDAVRKLVRFTFNYFVEHPEFILLLNSENLFEAEHIKKSKKLRDMHSSLIGKMEDVLSRGVRAGLFRNDVNPMQFYITVAALSYFYLSNASTLETIFGKDLKTKSALKERLAHSESVILGYLRR